MKLSVSGQVVRVSCETISGFIIKAAVLTNRCGIKTWRDSTRSSDIKVLDTLLYA